MLWLTARLAAAGATWLGWASLYGLLAVGLHLASLVRARLRSPMFRYSVSVPGMAFLALGALSGPWLLALWPLRLGLAGLGAERALGVLAWLDWVPVAVVVASLATSMRNRTEFVRIRLAGPEEDGRCTAGQAGEPTALLRLPVEWARRPREASEPRMGRGLRIVQVADPHLGPWQPEARLRRRIEALLAHDPDLVLLTGDFLTMEGNGTPGALARALAPLARFSGRSFAVFGNHDHEAPEEVRAALCSCGVKLLVDAEQCVETPVGPVQIVGADWYRERRGERLRALLAACPRRAHHLRVLLLHDPLGFRELPPGEVELTLSGHTHGGQVGLVSLGLSWTVLRRSRWPDHGLFGWGASRLYVHRGTGFYGFPLRIGVPGEASVLEVVPARAARRLE